MTKENNEKTENFKADIKYNPTDHKDKKLDIVANNLRLDMTGFFFVNGKIMNSGDTHSNNTNVISIVYDKNNVLVGVWYVQTDRYDIPFSNGIIYNTNNRLDSIISDIKLYTLTESNNYSDLK